RIRLQALAHEYARFPMRVSARFGEGNVRGQGHIARNLFPDEVEGVIGEPHVFTAAGHGVGAVFRIVVNRAVPQRSADLTVTFENAHWGGLCAGLWNRYETTHER